MMRYAAIGLAAGLALAAAPALAQQGGGLPTPYVGENLLVGVPDGYKVDYTAKNAKASISEMVPKAETVHDWSEMVTVQIFFGLHSTPQQFKARVEALWRQTCTDANAHQIAEADENGYPVLVWMLVCPRNPQSGKPEWTWFKAIAGNDSFYLVQKAFRFEPSKEQVVRWTQYLRGVTLCDSRARERSCAGGAPQ